jgi:hypothetical protein
VDVLSDVTQAIRLKGLISGGLELAAPWGMRVPKRAHPSFYAVARGNCVVEVEGVEGTHSVAGGDLFFLPRGSAHVIRDARRTRPQPYEKVMACASRDGQAGSPGEGTGPVTAFVAGCFSLDEGPRCRMSSTCARTAVSPREGWMRRCNSSRARRPHGRRV